MRRSLVLVSMWIVGASCGCPTEPPVPLEDCSTGANLTSGGVGCDDGQCADSPDCIFPTVAVESWSRGIYTPVEFLTGGYGSASFSFPGEFADLDGDGLGDLSYLGTYRGHDGDLASARLLPGSVLALEGNVPLLSSTALYESHGSGDISHVGPGGASAGDLDGDGLLDLVMAQDRSYLGPVLLGWYGTPGVEWTGPREPELIGLDSSWYTGNEAVFVGDVTGDGVDDIALRGVGGSDGTFVGVLPGGRRYDEVLPGDLAATIEVGAPSGGFPVILGRAGDIAGEPGDDLLIQHPWQSEHWDAGDNTGYGSTVYVLEGGTIEGALDLEADSVAKVRFPHGELSTPHRSYAVGDLDGDGQDDLVLGDPEGCPWNYPADSTCGVSYAVRGKLAGELWPGTDDGVVVLLYYGGRHSQNVVFGEILLAADLDGDGIDDLLSVGEAGLPKAMWTEGEDNGWFPPYQGQLSAVVGLVWKGRPDFFDGDRLRRPDLLLTEARDEDWRPVESWSFHIGGLQSAWRYHADLDGDGEGDLVSVRSIIWYQDSLPDYPWYTTLVVRVSSAGIATTLAEVP